MEPKSRLSVFLLSSWACILFSSAESKCSRGCDLALASYKVWIGSNLTYISQIMESKVVSKPEDVVSYNKDTIKHEYLLPAFSRINIPFPCDCIDGELLGHTFLYELQPGETYTSVANKIFSSLNTDVWMQSLNIYPPSNIPDFAKVNVTVNCSCGNGEVSKDYGLFITYPLGLGDTLQSIADQTKLDAELLQRYNPGVNFSQGSGLVFIPGKEKQVWPSNLAENWLYMTIFEAGLARGLAAVGISIGGTCLLLLLAICIYVRYFRKKNEEEAKLPQKDSMVPSAQDVYPDTSGDTGVKFIMVDKSPEFSYEELANTTNNFSLANKIGQGGFGEVYYANLRDEKTAVKKMKVQASQEFLAELKVLTSVHHWNLVRLIGYCVEGSLFLVYEYMDNGNLSQHLRNSEREPMAWSTRVRIALDVAKGLEYIHYHSVPVYIHRDIKSENILLNRNFNVKIADFGLTKLTDAANSSNNTIHMAGTFGYMPPENAYGHISRKIDVYAFGVVLYELISAKAAVIQIDKPSTEFKSLEIKTDESTAEFQSLVALFDEVIDHKGTEGLRKLVDPRLGVNYSIDSICTMAKLAKAYTDRDPKRRPTMRAVVVALMTLNFTTDDRRGSAEVNSSTTEALSDEFHCVA